MRGNSAANTFAVPSPAAAEMVLHIFSICSCVIFSSFACATSQNILLWNCTGLGFKYQRSHVTLLSVDVFFSTSHDGSLLLFILALVRIFLLIMQSMQRKHRYNRSRDVKGVKVREVWSTFRCSFVEHYVFQRPETNTDNMRVKEYTRPHELCGARLHPLPHPPSSWYLEAWTSGVALKRCWHML